MTVETEKDWICQVAERQNAQDCETDQIYGLGEEAGQAFPDWTTARMAKC